jgi:hypothetical protein
MRKLHQQMRPIKKEGDMRRGIFVVLVTTSTFVATQAVMADPPGVRLTADQIRQQLIDHTISGVTAGLPFELYSAPDGTQQLKMTNFKDTGTWHIVTDGHWCRTWRVALGGMEDCTTVYQSGETYFSVTPNGAVRSTYTAKQGNPDHL